MPPLRNLIPGGLSPDMVRVCVYPVTQIDDVPEIMAVHKEAFVEGYATDELMHRRLTDFVHGEFAGRKPGEYTDAIQSDSILVLGARLLLPDKPGELGPLVGVGMRSGANITSLYVRPDLHHHGIGSAILSRLLQGMEGTPISLCVTSWADSVGFYEASGFERTTEAVPTPEPPKAYGVELTQIKVILRDAAHLKIARKSATIHLFTQARDQLFDESNATGILRWRLSDLQLIERLKSRVPHFTPFTPPCGCSSVV